jgi:glycosyltransferase involved in cell wall biosynthesis
MPRKTASTGRGAAALQKRLLWFTDTLTDLNGVAVTLREVARCAHETGRPLKVVTSLPPSAAPQDLPPTTINLPCLYALTPGFYNALTLRIPSLWRSMAIIAAEHPDEIVISTPGPVGLLGLVAARLLGVPCVGIYHTDFTKQAELIFGERWVCAVVELYTCWFFRMMHEVRLPTRQYMSIMAARGLSASRMSLFQRTIDPAFSRLDPEGAHALRMQLHIPDGVTLLWAGRMGAEKNLGFLFDVYEAVAAHGEPVNLLLAGDGPELEPLRQRAANNPRILFAGRVERRVLPLFYQVADAFVFPSTTDTFGMVVLEAQACGLPAVVTNVGGPQEIVRHGDTGYVVPAGEHQAWVQTVLHMVDRRLQDPAAFERWRDDIRAHAQKGFGWDMVLDQMMGPRPSSMPAAAACTTPELREAFPA